MIDIVELKNDRINPSFKYIINLISNNVIKENNGYPITPINRTNVLGYDIRIFDEDDSLKILVRIFNDKLLVDEIMILDDNIFRALYDKNISKIELIELLNTYLNIDLKNYTEITF